MGGRELLPLSRTSQNIFGTRVSYNHEFTDRIVTVIETWKSVVSPGSLTFTEGVRSKQGSLCSPFYHRSEMSCSRVKVWHNVPVVEEEVLSVAFSELFQLRSIS